MTTFLIVLAVVKEVAPVVPWWQSPGFLALLGTIFGGIGLKVAEHFLNKPSRRAEARRDLNAENKDLLGRIDVLEQEVTDWRQKFYDQQEEIAVLRQAMIKGGIELPDKKA